MNRRDFLRRCVHATVGGVGLYSALGSMRLVSAATAHTNGGIFPDYKALVCVFLYGGNDSFNTIVPRDASHYATYAASRGSLAVPQGQLLALNPLADGLPGDGAQYGLHPSMSQLAGLFNTGRAAVMANVGPLLYPITKPQYQAQTVPVPPQLFSHDDQANFWQTARADNPNANGWGGRVADMLYSGNPNQNLSMLTSLSGEALFQRGETVNQYIMSSYGVEPIGYLDSWGNDDGVTAFNALMQSGTQAHVFERAYANKVTGAIANYEVIGSALNQVGNLTTAFPDTDLGRQLRMVARLIKARNVFDMRRQIFFVAQGGYDTHGDQTAQHPALLEELSGALKAFYDATVELNVANNVTAFTASDFGRTLSINGDGTDHGWGGHQFVVGGAVRGQRFYGRMPSLAQNNNPDDAGYGQLIPTMAVDQYSATLARWFGLSETGITDIFPNVGRFSTSNLGFFNP
ncbi:DUF1501 domain-containing protein [Tahibacter amnicola]|uniref:DUF1501 domain-containing protein n=1 Tax=Tahibacter amnicola TaxID=2976241 RepID=A0ABY6BBZ6_9GAMM|nr:DUF1501 domain-containing protein [Tahibacter amnicola]UXI67224.1 DUF1501 domain-containing protein [Tahibacter amnicola]